MHAPLRRALPALHPALAATALLGIFVNLALLVPSIYSMQVYDRVLASRNLTTLLLLTAVAIGFLGVYGLLEYARMGILQRASMRLDNELAPPLLALALGNIRGCQERGAQALRDADTLRDFIAGGLIAALMDVPWIPVFMLLCFILHPVLGCVALVGAAIVLGMALATEWSTRTDVERANHAAGESSRLLGGILANSEVVRGLGMQQAVLARWQAAQLERFAAQTLAGDRNGAMLAAAKFARMAIQIALMCTGAWLSLAGDISPGAMLASSILMGRALGPLEQVVAQWKRVVSARAAYQRLLSVEVPRQQDRKRMLLPEPKGDLVVEDLVVVPPGAARASVLRVSFSLAAGEALAVIGTSGSGKSSLARALTGVWGVAEGDVRLDGAALGQWDAEQLGRALGYLPQDVELFAGTVAENIARLAAVDDREVTRAARAAGAHEAILRLPQGYATPVGAGGAMLSGGMRQRIGLARAIYGSPRFVVLDEPNSNLDAAGEQSLADTLARLKADGTTVVVVTHRPQLLGHVDKVLVLGDGAVRLFGPRDHVLAQLNASRAAAPRGRPANDAAASAR